jgi:uncharacterized lipoprotein YddW (UPF0748 family)
MKLPNRKTWFSLLVAFAFTISLVFPALVYSQTPKPPAPKPTTPAIAPAKAQPKFKIDREIRGTWITNIDSDVLFTPGRVKKFIQELKDQNFNTIYPVVWNWGYTTYPSFVANQTFGSRFMPKKSAGLLLKRTLTKEEGLEGRDVLEEIVSEGHKQGMKVIPWFEFGFMAPDVSDPAGSSLSKKKADWLTVKQDGSKIWKEGKDPRVWLNPFRPEVQGFMSQLVAEVVRKYDIDGIQFDDHFGLPSEFGYDKFTTKLYQSEHDGKLPPKDFKDQDWVNWRADKITEYMDGLARSIRASRPKAIVSVSPNPLTFAKNFFLQDWAKWERQGSVDELIIQIYRDDMNVFKKEIAKPEVKLASTSIRVAIGILSGLKPKPISIQQIQDQITAVRQQGLAGVSFFFYETLWNLSKESAETRKAGFKQAFAESVPR